LLPYYLVNHAIKISLYSNGFVHFREYFPYSYIQLHIYVYTYIHIHVYIRIHIYIHTHMYRHPYVHIYIYMYKYVYIHIYVYTYIYTYIYIRMYIYTYFPYTHRASDNTATNSYIYSDNTATSSRIFIHNIHIGLRTIQRRVRAFPRVLPAPPIPSACWAPDIVGQSILAV